VVRSKSRRRVESQRHRVQVGLVALIVGIWAFVMIVALPQDWYTTRTVCLMTIAFMLGLHTIPLVEVAYRLDPT